jgi:hypothetical protein
LRLEAWRKENGIQDEDIYNFDETGFAMGLINQAGANGSPRLNVLGQRDMLFRQP